MTTTPTICNVIRDAIGFAVCAAWFLAFVLVVDSIIF